MQKLLLLWAAIAASAFAQNQGGGITQPGVPGPTRTATNPTTIACTPGVTTPTAYVYNNGGTDQLYTCGPSGFYIESPGGSTSTLAGTGTYAGGAAGANNVLTTAQGTGASQRQQNSKNQDQLSVKDFSVPGDGTDQTAILASFFSSYYPSGETYLLPQGTYNTTSPLVANGGVSSLQLQGTGDFSIFQYTGTGASPVLTIQNTASPGNPIYGSVISNHYLLGNANSTYSLSMTRPSQSLFSNLTFGPSNTTSGGCMYVIDGVGNTYTNLRCDQNHLNGWPGGVAPFNGIIFDGSTPGVDESTTSTIITPIIQGIPGTAIWLKDAVSHLVTSAQVTVNTTGLRLDSPSSFNMFTTGLFENSSGHSADIYSGFNIFDATAFTGTVHLGPLSGFNHFSAANIETLLIDSGARRNIIEGSDIRVGNLIDNSIDTVYLNNFEATDALPVENFPQIQQPFSSRSNFTGGVQLDAPMLWGGFYFASAASPPATVSPTNFTSGQAWTAWFHGGLWTSSSGGIVPDVPSIVELTNVNNTLVVQSHTLTFSVDPTSKQFQFTVTPNDGVIIGYDGQIDFTPYTLTGTPPATALSLSGQLNAPMVMDSGLTSGNCVQASTGGLLTSPAKVCSTIYNTADLNRTATPGSPITVVTGGTGQYRLTFNTASNSTVCTNAITVNWTNKNGAQITTVVGTTASSGAGVAPVDPTSGNVTYTPTIIGTCAGGTGFDTRVTVEQLQ